MIAFVQPFGLQDSSGGGRILRALLQDAPAPFLSVCTGIRVPAPTPLGREVHVPPRPHFGRLEGTRFGPWLRVVSSWRRRAFEHSLEQTLRSAGADVVHTIPHGESFWQAFEIARRNDMCYVLNVHDDMRYNLPAGPRLERLMERLAYVWPRADECIVISEAMGEEYCRRYGDRAFEVITDGLSSEVHNRPQERAPKQARIYFMGALHLSYHANFEVLADAVDRLVDRTGDLDLRLVLRGSGLPHAPRAVPVRELPYAPEEVVQRDLGEVDILYLPLPFGREYESFTRFSLSTKLVTYLGSGLPILYHGPPDAAAARLLAQHGAAVQVHSLDARDLAAGVEAVLEKRMAVAEAGLQLGRRRFRLSDQRDRFWTMLARHSHDAVSL